MGKHVSTGKLPVTFRVRLFDRHDIKPLFPFGYGLSCAKFSYSGLCLVRPGDTCDVTFKAKNDGKVKGMEITGLYVHDPDPKADAPAKALKGFNLVVLKSGQTEHVRFTLTRSDFAHYDATKDMWTHTQRGRRFICSSSRDMGIRGTLRFE